jgi:hypothetical protein
MPILLTSLILAVAPAIAGQTTAPVAAKQVTSQPALPGLPTRTPSKGTGEVAKRAPINGVLVLYGNERCPTNNDGDEIVICERRDAQEQYRVPKELRNFVVTPENESWAAKAQSTYATGPGVDTIGSCSAVGAGGNLGCFVQQANAARAEKRANAKAADPDLP